ncbi:hypothetical protein ACTMU2_31335 [Cupriavidus basilensis]
MYRTPPKRCRPAPLASRASTRKTRPAKSAPLAERGLLADADAAPWDWLDVQSARIPRIVTATQEQFVPQMVNLELVGERQYLRKWAAISGR